VVYGVSVDSAEQNRAMIEKLLLPFSLLSDSEGDVSRRYGVWDEDGQIARPAIFVLDHSGLVRYVYVGEDFADRPGDREVHAAVRELAQ
jgi:glutaredoxin-dependent peroxiredoxin